MKITIFGATGRTGKFLVEQALSAGDKVIAFVRDPSKIDSKDKNLKIVQGDATNLSDVERAIKGTDAVISVMSTSASQKIARTKPLTRGTQNIIDAMKKYDVKRIIISTGDIPQSKDLPSIRLKLLMGFGNLFMRYSFEDTIDSARVVQASDLDWTVVRIAPTNALPTNQVNAGYVNKETKMFISRSDAAMFMLKELKEKKWVQQAPVIFNK